MDKKDARESRGSTDRKNHSSEKTKKIKYVTKYAGLYRTEAFSVYDDLLPLGLCPLPTNYHSPKK